MNDNYDPTWTLRCDGGNSEKRRHTFDRLARRAVLAVGFRFNDPLEALDAWLNRLHRHHYGLKTRFGGAYLCIKHLPEAAAEYCAELSTRFHLDGNADAEDTFSHLEEQFRELEDPDAEFVAIRRRDSFLRRDNYPSGAWLYSHAHEPLQNPAMELDYWSNCIWRGYQDQIEHWTRLDRTGPAYAALPEKLMNAAIGLSYDFAVLQANHTIYRGLRGDEATQAFQAEADKLLERVKDIVRSSWVRLGFSCDAAAEGPTVLAEAFDRVRDDFCQLLERLPPTESPQLTAQAKFDDSTNEKAASAANNPDGTGSPEPQIVIVPGGIPSSFRAGTPGIVQDLEFHEKRYRLDGGPDDLVKRDSLYRDFRLLAQEAETFVSKGSSLHTTKVDDWLDRIRSPGLVDSGTNPNGEPVKHLLTLSANHLKAIRVNELRVRDQKQADGVHVLETDHLMVLAMSFEALRDKYFSAPYGGEDFSAIPQGILGPIGLQATGFNPPQAQLGLPYSKERSESIPEQAASSGLDKGNLALLRGTDGQLKRAVTLEVARRFGGVSLRAIQDAAQNGKLRTEGRRQQRRVLVDSLLNYFPPEK